MTELTADFTRALPGGKLDDATYEAIESALDRAGATIQDGPRWLTLAERVDALGRIVVGLNVQLTEQFELSTKFAAVALKAEHDREALLASLRDFLENPLFQVSVGGNPIAVDAMLARAREAIVRAEGLE